jgi:hypothetical protein
MHCQKKYKDWFVFIPSIAKKALLYVCTYFYNLFLSFCLARNASIKQNNTYTIVISRAAKITKYKALISETAQDSLDILAYLQLS